MLRTVLLSLYICFALITANSQTQTLQELPDSNQEIVNWVQSGQTSWLDQSTSRLRVMIAFVQTKQGDLPELPEGSWAEWLATQHGIEVVDAYAELAVFHSRKGELESALNYLNDAENELRNTATNDSLWYVKHTEVLDAKAEVLWMAGKPLLAVEALNTALTVERPDELPLPPQTRSRLNNNMGIVQWNLGEMEMALQYFYQALEAYAELFGPEHPKTGRCHNNIGVVLLHLGDLGRARSRFESALDIAEKDPGSHTLRSMIHNNLGIIALSENTPKKALVHFERSQEELDAGNNGVAKNQMDVWRFKAEAFAALQDTLAALSMLNKAIEFTSGVKGELGVHAAELLIQRSKLQPRERLPILLDAESMMRSEGITHHPDYARLLQSIGLCHLEEKKLDTAKVWLDRGHQVFLAKLRSEEADKGIIASYAHLAKWNYLHSGKVDDARIYWDSSMYYMDFLRIRTPYPDSRNNFFKLGDEVYPEALFEAYGGSQDVRMTSAEDATFIFKCIEHSKSFTFSQHIQDQRNLNMTEAGRRTRSILAEYNFIRSQVNQLAVGTEEERSLRKRLNELSEELQGATVANSSFQQYAPPELREIQDHLLEHEVYLSFFSGKQHTYAFATTGDSSIGWRVDTDTLQTLLAKQKRELWQLDLNNTTANEEQFQQVLVELHGLLIAPVIDHFSADRILISTHGVLADLNVNSLVRSVVRGPMQEWDFLVHHLDLTRVTSAWEVIHRNNELTPGTLSLGIWASDFSRQRRLSPLSNTSVEANAVSGLMNGTLFLNEHCTLSSFMDNANNFDILHLALHGSSGSLTAEGCIYFEEADSTLTLDLSELMAFGLVNPLTVLGSCEGGKGDWTAGETTNSMTKAFLTAGSQQVLHSQWNLEDGVYATIIEGFYEELKRGAAPSEALRIAQSRFLRQTQDPLYAHPHFWSGLEMNGPDPMVVKGQFKFISWKTGLWFAGLLVILGVWLMRTRR